MKQHGIKLKGFEGFRRTRGKWRGLGQGLTPVVTNYGISKDDTARNPTPDDVSNRNPKRRCPKCNKLCEQMSYYKRHVRLCGTGALFKCPKCPISFEKVAKLNKHLQLCGREKDVLCQLCDYKCLALDRMTSHYLNIHNLICTMVKEPDFDQALSSAPYILERPMEIEKLPSKAEVAKLGDATVFKTEEKTIPVRKVDFSVSTTKKMPVFCKICKKEFTKKKFLNRHMNRGCD